MHREDFGEAADKRQNCIDDDDDNGKNAMLNECAEHEKHVNIKINH